MKVYDCIVVKVLMRKGLEENSEGDLDGESDISEGENMEIDS
jgi:hypothetical protein